jgi:hypothetical protein
MGVHVDGLDALAADHHRQFLTGRLRACAVQHSTTAEDDTGSGRHAALEKITPCGHDNSSHGLFCGAWYLTTPNWKEN